ncbi:MAG: glycosyltransferase family 4 protein, partial [Bacteroidetes bacterium]|nr:glycosyltransferase family 4 protein [Bacteroidota bacterium]
LNALKNTNFIIVRDNDFPQLEPSYFIRKIKSIRRRLYKILGQNIKKPEINILDLLCDKYRIDIIHCPYQFIPVSTKAKLITTLHDVQELHFPEYFSAEERARRAISYLDFLRRANSVIVSYSHVKNDLIKYFEVPNEKVDILLLKMDKLWFEKYTKADAIDVTSFFRTPFFLYPANTWKHKNHLRLIEAIANVRDKYNVVLNLICTGHKNEHFAIIEESIQKYNLQKQVKFLGVVNEITLYSLYTKCKAVVIPTTYEAGSFPLYESIMLGKPVICSNVTSLPETIGSNEFVFDPFNIEDISLKMIQIWQNEEYYFADMKQLNIASQKLKDHDPLKDIQNIYEKVNA